MTAKFWTLLTGVDTVQPFYDQAEAETAAANFVQSCDDSRIVTVENWRDELAALNKEMDDAGEAGYLCTLTEHSVPELKAVAVLEEGEVCRIETASPLLQHLKVAVVETKFSRLDYHPDDVFQVETPHGPIDAVGHVQAVQPQDWPIETVFERICASEPVRVI
ncbi:hypothetical protein IC232_05425 [Microvirga sp. BT688]|uniref:hypothetical protein n=1 Tax=Microvirga sp. TaxID=1873136 RepID=UPI00168841FC|nr:hypothetical protein [Microvirga sp.]MBD2746138.1 hypothetical protein [Microvirga sp.]